MGEHLLEVKDLWWEPGVRDSQGRRAALASALDRLTKLVGAEEWAISSPPPAPARG